MFAKVSVALLVAHNGRPCPRRIKVKSAEAKVLRKAHIEDIASSLGESMFFRPSEVWQEHRVFWEKTDLAFWMQSDPVPCLSPSFKET